MQDLPLRKRRRHSAELKAQILAACALPGASVASIALEHGINANVVHRWRRLAEARPAVHRARAAVSEFVPVSIADSGSVPRAGDIRIELRRAGTTVSIAWPVAAASACSTWLRDLLT